MAVNNMALIVPVRPDPEMLALNDEMRRIAEEFAAEEARLRKEFVALSCVVPKMSDRPDWT